MVKLTDRQAELDKILGVRGSDRALIRVRPAREKLFIFLAAVWALAFIAVGTWATYWADLRNDQYQLINLGRCVHDGGRMYVDCWENKPPGIAWINALGISLSRGGQIGAWLMPGIAGLLCITTFGFAVRRLLSTTAACGAVAVASVLFSIRLYDAPSINPDYYSAAFELVAGSLWLVSLGATSGGRRLFWCLAAGVLWAGAATFKHTGVVGLLAVTIVMTPLVTFQHDDRRRRLASGACVWGGFALALAAVIGMLAIRQTLEPAREAVFGFNRGLWNWDAVTGVTRSWSRVVAGLAPIQLALWLGLLGTIATLHTGRANRITRGVVAVLLLWWILQTIFALIGPSRSMRYWQATFPPMLWLVGVGFYHIEDTFHRLERGYRAVLSVTLLTLLVLLAMPLAEHYQQGLAGSYLSYAGDDPEHAPGKQTQRERLQAEGQQIRSVVPAGEPIYVWAYDAGIYVYADRPCACRFTYPRSVDQMEEILSSLSNGKAAAILVPGHGSPEFELWCDEACHQRLESIIDGYDKGENIGRYRVWIQP